MQTDRIAVQRENRSRPKGFTPKAQVMEPGDAVFWFNEDQHTSHQPVPDDPSNGIWVADPIGPGQESDQANFTNEGVLPYHCKFHAEETASLNVVATTTISRDANDVVTFAAAQISVGGFVWWRNLDPESEHEPAPDNAAQRPWFNSPLDSGARSIPVQFNAPGTVNYHCALHPAEKGTITITAAKRAGG